MRRIQIIRLRQLASISFSLVVALVLMIIPISKNLQAAWPQWLSLVIIYWVTFTPRLIGIMTAWCLGLSMDILGGRFLGQYALSLSVVAFLTIILRNRIRLFSLWQKSLSILVIIGFGQLIFVIVHWFMGKTHPPQNILIWMSTLSSMLIWPLIEAILKIYQRKLIF
ncbi:MAG: rod shape-determining protein MreD [Francisellaceae bacterium]|nr:rod shape-determining protein MreD [Francisellaceae bacterium]